LAKISSPGENSRASFPKMPACKRRGPFDEAHSSQVARGNMVIETQLACEWKANMPFTRLSSGGAAGTNFDYKEIL
jgi:hypothetical protein